MKQLIFFVLAVLATAGGARSQDLEYVNNSSVIYTAGQGAPQIDAFNFINNGRFSITLIGTSTNLYLSPSTFPPYEFSDVTNYVNRGLLSSDTGFIFDNEPSTSGVPTNAVSFLNANTGTISTTGNEFFPYVLVRVAADKLTNTGVFEVGQNGLVTINGGDVDMSHGTLHVRGFDDASVVANTPDLGIFDYAWGLGVETNVLNRNYFNVPFTRSPPFAATNTTGFSFLDQVPRGANGPVEFEAVVFTNIVNDSNILYQVVFVNTNLGGIGTDVRFASWPGSDFPVPVIQWTAALTNSAFLKPTTNYLYVQDFFGAVTNFELITNSFTFSGVPHPQPFNYEFLRDYPNYPSFLPGNVLYTPANQQAIFQNAFGATNQYSSYTVIVEPVTSIPDSGLPGSTITNSPGRIFINASGNLDLTAANVVGPNYMNITATNNFRGSAGARISAPYMDIDVAYTNKDSMIVSNLVAPYLNRFNGPIQMWSARWTNVVNDVTNSYHTWIVYADLAPTSSPLIVNLAVKSTNVTAGTFGAVEIHDNMTVSNICVIAARTLTIGTNSPGAPTPTGQLNLITGSLWGNNVLPYLVPTLPGVSEIYNWGEITAVNVALGDANSPLARFENHGSSSSSGFAVTANYFESAGGVGVPTTNLYVIDSRNSSAIIASSYGPISIQAPVVVLSKGSLVGTNASGDITIKAGSLRMKDQVVQTSGALTLGITDDLNADYSTNNFGAFWMNTWRVNDGFNLLVKPVTGDFLGTTIEDVCPSGLQVNHTWAGADMGANVDGFKNNAAVGHLILNGNGTNCTFFFTGTSVSNAIYVDQLDLRGAATNIFNTSQGVSFTALNLDSNIRIYYADAVLNGGALDISQRLDNQFGGRIRWVRDYTGIFSGTNITYTNGITYTFNRALASSTTIDSNGNGTVNGFDQFPFSVGPTVTVSNQTASLSWMAIPNSTNSVYYSANLATTNWTLLTKIIQGPVGSTLTVTDPVSTNSARYYKIQIQQ